MTGGARTLTAADAAQLPEEPAGPTELLLSHTSDYRVRFDEAGEDGTLRPGGFLRFGQDLAWRHSEATGYGRARYVELGVHWLVRAVVLEEYDRVPDGTSLRVTTELTGWRRVWARRLTTFRLPGSSGPVARMTVDWVLVDERGRPTRVPDAILRRFPAPRSFTPIHLEGLPPGEGAVLRTTRVTARDVDPMGIANNAAWLDHVAEALAEAEPEVGRARPRTWRLEYLRPARDGQCIVLLGRRDGAGRWTCRVDGESGEELLRANLVTG
jgi:acyl-CoA thioesterase FadM